MDSIRPTTAATVSSSPVVHGDLLFAPSRERPLLALKPGGRGDVTKSHVLWSFNNGPGRQRRVNDGTYLYSTTIAGSCICLDA